MALESGSHGEHIMHVDVIPTDMPIIDVDTDTDTDDPVLVTPDTPGTPDEALVYTIPDGDATGMDLSLFFDEGNTRLDTRMDDEGHRTFSITFDDNWELYWTSNDSNIFVSHNGNALDLVPTI